MRGNGRKPWFKTPLRKWTPCVSRGTLDACVRNGSQKHSPAAFCQVPREQGSVIGFPECEPDKFWPSLGNSWSRREPTAIWTAQSERKEGNPEDRSPCIPPTGKCHQPSRTRTRRVWGYPGRFVGSRRVYGDSQDPVSA